MKKLEEIRGTFTSVWDGGVEVNTPATMNYLTGEIFAENSDVNGVEILEEEFFTTVNGGVYKICPVCHEFRLKTIMVDGIGKTLEEKTVCSNRECENGEDNM